MDNLNDLNKRLNFALNNENDKDIEKYLELVNEEILNLLNNIKRNIEDPVNEERIDCAIDAFKNKL